MDVQLDALIKKINQEGVDEANKQADTILQKAESKAQQTIKDAQKEAARLIAEAKAEAAAFETRSEQAIQQAGRDLLLSLESNLQSILRRLVAEDVAKSLSGERLAEILATCLKGWSDQDSSELTAYLSEADCEAVQAHFTERLQAELEGFTLRPHRAVQSGFRISRGSDGVQWDFTGKGLSDLVAAYLNPRVAALVRGD